MIVLTLFLLARPESTATDSNNVRARRFAHTYDGREVLCRFAQRVYWLTETQDAYNALQRVQRADEWQPAFEAAVDAQRELEMALWGEAGPLAHPGAPEAQRVVWAARNAELELLSRRVMDWAVEPLRSRGEAYMAHDQLSREEIAARRAGAETAELIRLRDACQIAYAEYRAWVAADHVAAISGALD